jgi:glycosyltransferase involved in cell wall biosynthesis
MTANGQTMPSPPQPSPERIDLTVMVTCFNEAGLIRGTLDTVRGVLAQFPYRYEVLIYDDASRDESVAVVRAYIATHHLEESFFLIANPQNQGIGVNYFRAAERGRGEYFYIVHGDNASPPAALTRVLGLMGQADMIVPYFRTRLFATRYNCDHRPFSRRLLSLLFAATIRLPSGHELRYFNGWVLHKRTNVLANRVEAYGLGFQAELLCKILQEPTVEYLEVRQHNLDESGTTTAFRLKNVLSVLGSLGRIAVGRFG